MYGMRCGGGSIPGGCPSGQRCTGPAVEHNYSGNIVRVGTCAANAAYPCADECYVQSANAAPKCGDGIGSVLIYKSCPTDSVCEPIAIEGLSNPFPGITSCAVPFCSTFSPSGSVSQHMTIGVCKKSVSCESQCATDADCTSLGPDYTCEDVPQLDGSGTVIGTRKECIDNSSGGCELPPSGTGNTGYYICSNGTGCATDEYCMNDDWNWTHFCAKVTTGNSYPPDCFVGSGQACGTGFPNGTDAGFPLNKFCSDGLSCLNTAASTLNPIKDPASYPVYSASTLCAKCVTTGGTCDGTMVNATIDDCCSKDKKCVDGTCKTEGTYQYCSGTSGPLKPGSTCQYKGFASRCGSCPLVNGSEDSVELANGDRRCFNIGEAGTSCTDACGCNAGETCDGGSCVPDASCVDPDATCVNGGPVGCCDPGGTDYTCTAVGGSYKCKSSECTQVMAGTLTCVGRASCCTGSTSICDETDGKCKAEGDCVGREDGACCGYAMECLAGSCVASTKEECAETVDPIGGAGGYTGPPVTIPDLLKAVGSILYPAGIGIGLFFIVKAGYELMVSQGDPNAVKSAQESLTAAIIGIIFIILSSTILKLIINSLLG